MRDFNMNGLYTGAGIEEVFHIVANRVNPGRHWASNVYRPQTRREAHVLSIVLEKLLDAGPS